MPIAITAEQLGLQASIREWAKQADTIGAVRSQDPADTDGVGERLLGLPREEAR